MGTETGISLTTCPHSHRIRSKIQSPSTDEKAEVRWPSLRMKSGKLQSVTKPELFNSQARESWKSGSRTGYMGRALPFATSYTIRQPISHPWPESTQG